MAQAKTERITILASPEFKHALSKRARSQGLSLAEFARARLSDAPTDDEVLLVELTRELTEATTRAAKALDAGLRAVTAMEQRIKELRAQTPSKLLESPLQGEYVGGEPA